MSAASEVLQALTSTAQAAAAIARFHIAGIMFVNDHIPIAARRDCSRRGIGSVALEGDCDVGHGHCNRLQESRRCSSHGTRG